MECGAFVCPKCTDRYSPNEGFAIYLRQHCDKPLLPYFTRHKETIQYRSRSIEGAIIYHEYQKYTLSEEYVEELTKEIKIKQDELDGLTDKAKRVREKLLEYKVELYKATSENIKKSTIH